MRNSRTWLRLMLIAFLTNGLGPFGLKILQEKGLSAEQPRYLLYWYVGGSVFALLALARSRSGVTTKELLLGALMGACSLGGQSFTGLSLAHGIQGHIAFPVTTGGSLFLVAAAGLTVFRERVGWYGLAGIALGFTSIILLSLP